MHDVLIKTWGVLSLLMVAIPTVMLLAWLFKKGKSFWAGKREIAKENKAMAEIKTELESQQEEFISTNEYGTFLAPEEETGDEFLETLETEAVEAAQEPLSEQEAEALAAKNKSRIESLLMEAAHLKNAGKLEDYEKKLLEAMAIDNQDLELLKLLSDLYFVVGQYKKALPLLKKLSEQDPSNHRAFWQIGEIYFITGYYQTAELLVEKAINLKNDNPKYYLTMVEIYYNTQRMPEALAYMEKIIKLRPTNPKYLLATAELYEEMGDKDNAKKYYFNVLEYEPHNEKAKSKIKEFSHDWA